jgi:hypothetical protein
MHSQEIPDMQKIKAENICDQPSPDDHYTIIYRCQYKDEACPRNICGVAEVTPQQHSEGNTMMGAVITLWESSLTKHQTITFPVTGSDKLP